MTAQMCIQGTMTVEQAAPTMHPHIMCLVPVDLPGAVFQVDRGPTCQPLCVNPSVNPSLSTPQRLNGEGQLALRFEASMRQVI